MGVEYKDYYKILGVSKTASDDEINKAYKKLARKFHPDLNQNDPKAEERFKEVNEANEVLKDPEKRKMYDHLGPNWKDGQHFQRPPGFENMHFNFNGTQGFGASGFSDFFESVFGGGGFSQGPGQYANFTPQPRKGRNVEASLGLSLEDAFHGGKKNIAVSGRSLEVSIPAGIKSGAKIRLSGQGDPGMNNGPAGDLYLKIHILPHTHFRLVEADVLFDLVLAPWEAVLGCKARVPTLTGDIELNITPGTSSGKKLRIPGKGLGSGTVKGDQYVHIAIAVPDSLTAEEQTLWEKLRQTSSFKARD